MLKPSCVCDRNPEPCSLWFRYLPQRARRVCFVEFRDMRLRMLKTWRRLKPDTEVNIADGAANVLVKRGFAEPVQTVKRKRGSRRASNATQND